MRQVRGHILGTNALTTGELRSLFQVCSDSTPSSARDAAVLALLYGAGLRRSEVVVLDIDDYEPKTGTGHGTTR